MEADSVIELARDWDEGEVFLTVDIVIPGCYTIALV